MVERQEVLEALAVAVPRDTPVTAASMVKILDVLGIVSNHQLLGTMQLVTALLPASTPATVRGLLQLLGGLMKMNEKATATELKAINTMLGQTDLLPDAPLTFETFLPICQKLVQASEKKSVKG